MKDLQAEFEKFDRDNPRIWELIERFCREVINAGQEKWAISSIFERIRWEIYVVTKSQEDWKLNNNHRAYYARKWLKAHPEHPKFFETRKVRCEPDDDDQYTQGDFFA